MRKAVMTLVLCGLLTGCTYDEGEAEVKAILECTMAAKLVGQIDSVDVIADHTNAVAERYGLDLHVSDMKDMHDEIKAKWNLKSMNRHDQDVLLVGVYNSDFCAGLHRSRKITVEEVPAED